MPARRCSAQAASRSHGSSAGTATTASSGCEGARAGSVLGTYVHGPLLPKNPWLADWLLERALERRHGQVELAPLDDRLELAAAGAAAERGAERGR